MLSGAAPINLPNYLCTSESVVNPSDFYSQTPYEMAYSNFSNIWTNAGYQVQNVLDPGQPPLYTYIFDSNGYDFRGFNKNGINAQGYNRLGFNAQGYNAKGYNAQGYNAQGFNAEGYNLQGLDKNGNPSPALAMAMSLSTMNAS
jgi:hypothetical protein